MSKEKTTDSRRKLLKSLAVGSGAVVAGKSLPESWSKPVINSVVLPAHAETTDGSGSSGGDQTTAAPTTTADPCAPENYTIESCSAGYGSGPQTGEATLSATCPGINVTMQRYYVGNDGVDPLGGPIVKSTNASGVASFSYHNGYGRPFGHAVFTAANGATCESVAS